MIPAMIVPVTATLAARHNQFVPLALRASRLRWRRLPRKLDVERFQYASAAWGGDSHCFRIPPGGVDSENSRL